jgi:hypothetical protein
MSRLLSVGFGASKVDGLAWAELPMGPILDNNTRNNALIAYHGQRQPK